MPFRLCLLLASSIFESLAVRRAGWEIDNGLGLARCVASAVHGLAIPAPQPSYIPGRTLPANYHLEPLIPAGLVALPVPSRLSALDWSEGYACAVWEGGGPPLKYACP